MALKYLITGGGGQLGLVLARFLRASAGTENVILSDIVEPSVEAASSGPFVRLDVMDHQKMARLVDEHQITGVIHLAALLSALAEKKTRDAMRINVESLGPLFLLAKEKKLQLYVPSTIAAFGPDSPLDPTPDHCIQRPLSLYGVSKVYLERLGEYFHAIHGVDFRSLRYPGIISATPPGGGTTDYAVDVFFKGFQRKPYECYLRAETKLPFAYIDDAMENTVKFLLTPADKLEKRVYNYGAFDLTPGELFRLIRDHCLPELEVSYKLDPVRQAIADSWPKSFDFSAATNDWGAYNNYDAVGTVKKVYTELKRISEKGSSSHSA